MKPFKFKQFTIQQDQCAMKVGTDGVLLGAWSKTGDNPRTVLDIGSGTGLIALMLAQKIDAPEIDAVEIDSDTYTQCVENFEASPWNDRLFCYHAEFTEFVAEMYEDDITYDVIVSNPPFFSEEISSGNLQRDTARLNASLPFEDLIEGSSLLLSNKGIFNLIIPFKEEDNIISIAQKFNLHPFEILRVKGTPKTELKRSLVAFSFQKNDSKISEIVLETARHQYTQDYIELTKDFYLNM